MDGEKARFQVVLSERHVPTPGSEALFEKGARQGRARRLPLFTHKVFIKSFGKSQFPYKMVNLSAIITNTKNKSTDLCGN